MQDSEVIATALRREVSFAEKGLGDYLHSEIPQVIGRYQAGLAAIHIIKGLQARIDYIAQAKRVLQDYENNLREARTASLSEGHVDTAL